MTDPRYLNPWNLLTPRAGSANGAGNDPLLSAIYIERSRRESYIHDSKNRHWLFGCVLHALDYYQIKPGLFVRRPPPDILHQESWDNVLAWICMAPRDVVKRIIWYGVRHAGFYNTDGVLKREDWLWRYPHIWILAWLLAYPWTGFITKPLCRLCSKYLNADHPGGVLLDWLWLATADSCGANVKEAFDRAESKFKDAALDQMDADCPVNLI